MNVIRIVLFVGVCFSINYKVNMMLSPLAHASALIGYAFLKSVICCLVFVYSKWFAFIYLKNNKTNRGSLFTEGFILPTLSMMLFVTPLVGQSVLTFQFISLLIVGVFLVSDLSGELRRWLWTKRQYDFKGLPDSGIVDKKTQHKLLYIVMLLLIGIPVVGSLL